MYFVGTVCAPDMKPDNANVQNVIVPLGLTIITDFIFPHERENDDLKFN